MKIAAYCGLDWARAMRGAIGGVPVTCPPLQSGGDWLSSEWLLTFLRLATLCDVLVLNLHGYAGQANYYGQRDRRVGPTALTPQDVLEHDWSNVTVFCEVCYSAAGGQASNEIPQAFYKRGARAVVGSTTQAFGRVRPTPPIPGFDGEADRLLQFFLARLRRKEPPDVALGKAKRWLRLWSWPLDADDRATLESFKIIKKLGVKDAEKH